MDIEPERLHLQRRRLTMEEERLHMESDIPVELRGTSAILSQMHTTHGNPTSSIAYIVANPQERLTMASGYEVVKPQSTNFSQMLNTIGSTTAEPTSYLITVAGCAQLLTSFPKAGSIGSD